MIIAIDGPAGAGKSTVARLVAKRLGYLYINTGAMYRAFTLKALQNEIDLENENKLVELAKDSKISFENGGSRVILDGNDVSQEIRTPEIDKKISVVVKHSRLREIMVKQQQDIGKQGDAVSEGRDLTTVVFPDAEVKIYLDASLDERTKRRYKELKQKGYDLDVTQVQKDTARRDESDKTRKHGPLRLAQDAILLDTTGMNIEQVIESILDIVKKKQS
ncbi:MAG: CMP/dCMP kinase [Candidatus Poribacteria bacterium]|nr:CMP/dCMP kinase [Candidatus Poribacteria bacterium]